MAEPHIAKKGPYVVELEPGSYKWCACGQSAKQPFCDGSHKGSGCEPVRFEIHEKRKVGLCGCKHTGNPPFCDAAHRKL